MRWKLWTIRITITLAFIGLLVNLYNVQIQHSSYYVSKANALQEARGALDASRGIIYFTDKNGTHIPVVLNKEYPTIYAVPKEVTDVALAAKSLAPLVNKDEATLIKMLSKPNDQYELLVEKGSDQQVNQVRALNLKGIYIKNKTFRYYPFGTMASQVLGYVSLSQDGLGKGTYGLEAQFDDTLSGKDGYLAGQSVFAPQNGEDIYTTLDQTIQSEAEDILSSLVKEWGADGGTVLVQDPYSGNILAMANNPNFDPNDYSAYDLSSFINRAVQFVYEPGSVFKPVTMTAGIDSGKLTPNTTYTDTGSVTISGRLIQNWDHKAHGLTTMRGVIENSLNLGTIFAERTMGHSVFKNYVNVFGFGQNTGIELPGEVAGSLKNLDTNRDVNFATASFGQGLSVTPIQLITAFSAIANGGLLLKPHIIAEQQPEVVRRVASENTTKQVTDMMVSAVVKNVLAVVDSYNVAGKTGTAYVPDFKKGGYSDDVINTYMGFAPASRPKFVILIELIKPKNTPLAGQTVVPSFQKLTSFLLNYYQVAPDNISSASVH